MTRVRRKPPVVPPTFSSAPAAPPAKPPRRPVDPDAVPAQAPPPPLPLSKRLTTSASFAGQESYELVPLDEIVLKENVRTTYRKIEEMAGSLEKHGQQQPVVLHVDSAGRKVLRIGFRRYHAAKHLGWPVLRAIVRHDADDAPAKVLTDQLAENLDRDDMLPMDVARSLRTLMRTVPLSTHAQVVEALGGKRTQSWVSTYLALLDLSEEEQARVDAGTLGVVAGAALGRARAGNTRQRRDGGPDVIDRWKSQHAMPRLAVNPHANGGSSSNGSGSSSNGSGGPAATERDPAPVSVSKAPAAAFYFGDGHPLAGRASGRCRLHHQQRRTLPGGVACAECWEVVIRRDEALNPTQDHAHPVTLLRRHEEAAQA